MFPWCRFWSSFVLLLTLGNLRIGEARVPGPSPADPVSSWSIGVCNPSGLLGKSHIVGQIPSNVIAVSETHLTTVSKNSFLCSLKATSCGFQNMVTGAPMMPRSSVSEAGDWAGVSFLSKHPSRAMCVNWPPDLFDTGRIQFCASFVDPFWLCGGVVYGYPPGVTHPEAHRHTMDLLDFAVTYLTQSCVGPRYLAGDWNFEPHLISVWDTLLSSGWVEIQDLFERQTGVPPHKTCKFKTRKDYLWISPELVRQFSDLIVMDLFADHQVLCANFRTQTTSMDRWLWNKPGPIVWKGVPDISDVINFHDVEPSDAYHLLWHQREEQARTHLGSEWNNRMSGRASQRKPLRRRGWPSPLKKGRAHDIQPVFDGVSVQHARWFKQLRRLQSYHRWATSSKVDMSGPSEHGAALWKSILNASGFCPSFAVWWTSRSYQCPGDVGCIPEFPPLPVVALQIYHSLLAEVRTLEQRLQQARRTHANHRRATDPNIIFKDVRRPPALPVETLLDSTSTFVSQVDASESALELDPPCEFDLSQPLLVAGHAVTINHAEPDKVWVDPLPDVSSGVRVAQTRYLGSLPAIFDAFHEQWKRRWCKHDDIPNSQWQTIVDFASRSFKPQTVPSLPLDSALLQAEIHRKKKTAATGLDGASRLDFIHGGPNFLSSIVSMFNRACHDGTWPVQILAGSVASLAKTPSAATVNEYRPITIFGFAYRCWASIHARHLLDWTDTWVHPDIHGNRKHHQAAHLWSSIVQQIEEAYQSDRPLSGLTADIEKAYNCLPRWPVFCAAFHAGTPFDILVGWAGAVSSMKRHFKVRDSYSSGFATSTGLAEGCALSCYGMLLLDHLLHIWLHAQSPAVRCLSYVDNWDLLTWDPDWAVRQLDLVTQFAALLDLTVDRKKTYGWSTHAPIRAEMRRAGINTKHAARDLGAHIAYSRQHTNAALQERLEALEAFWPLLRRSPSPYHLKVRVLRTVAWKRGLHAISSAPIGRSRWTAIRSRAVQALWGRRSGVNPMVLLGLVEGSADPEEVALLGTVRDAREFQSHDILRSNLAALAFGLLQVPPNAPTAVLLDRLQHVGIHIRPDGLLEDRFGSFSLDSNYLELQLRLQLAWHRRVASHVAHRVDFAGLDWVDVFATRKFLAKLPVHQQTLFRLGLSGGSFTADYRCHWTSTGLDSCQWCGQPDSLHHRYWSCPQTEHLRKLHAPRVSPLASKLPPAMLLRGWALHGPSWISWVRMLSTLSRDIPLPLCAFPSTPWVDIFTDGSCFWQAQPSLRIAAWSAVIACSFSPSWSFEVEGLLGVSHLPGLIQTAYRAELYALAFTLHWISARRVRARIWSDCLGVVNNFQLLCKGKARIRPNASNADLWYWVERSLANIDATTILVQKVESHREVKQATTKLEAWRYWNNSAADRAARMANHCRPADFWQLWSKHAEEHMQIGELYEETVRLQMAVAEYSTQHGLQSPEETPLRARRTGRVFTKHYSDNGWDQHVPAQLSEKFSFPLAKLLVSWWSKRVHPEADLLWIPLHYLYLDFQMSTGNSGPLKVQNQWVNAASRKFLAPERFPHSVRVRWFRNFLQSFWRASQISTTIAVCRPDVEQIQAFVPCLAIRWDPWCISTVSQWLLSNIRKHCAREACELRLLPLAKPNVAFSLEPVDK